jgi:multisubunit Na+/H+ antiporter MnhE subunit
MTPLLLRAAGLAAIYLLVLTSVAPGDLLVGGLLGLTVAYWLRPHRSTGSSRPRTEPAHVRIGAAARVVADTGAEMVRGSWRVVRFCLGAPASPGIVEIPRDGRSPINVALWGVLTGEAPDEVPVAVDEARDVLLVHLVDAGDPAAVRARHQRSSEDQRKAVP